MLFCIPCKFSLAKVETSMSYISIVFRCYFVNLRSFLKQHLLYYFACFQLYSGIVMEKSANIKVENFLHKALLGSTSTWLFQHEQCWTLSFATIFDFCFIHIFFFCLLCNSKPWSCNYSAVMMNSGKFNQNISHDSGIISAILSTLPILLIPFFCDRNSFRPCTQHKM